MVAPTPSRKLRIVVAKAGLDGHDRGGIVAVNREVNAALGREFSEMFLACVIAPAFGPEVLTALAARNNLRLLAYDFVAAAERERAGDGVHEVRSVSCGVLVQTRDMATAPASAGKVVTTRVPTAAELADLDFAWHVSST